MPQTQHYPIRPFRERDWDQLWHEVIRPAFSEGESYMFDPCITQEEAYKVWIKTPQNIYVAVDDSDTPIATYYIKPNQPALGAHICNCGYIVSLSARGRGIARAMCRHSQTQAREMGFRGMQFNAVVSTNTTAVKLWLSLGFEKVGVVPDGFHSRSFGYVPIYVMHKAL